MSTRLIIMGMFASVLALFSSFSAQSRILHHQKSLYQDIVVQEKNGLRCLVFAAIRGDHNQTCQYLDNDPRLVFSYARMSLAGLLLNPKPTRVLMVGLGGGSIPAALSQLYPQAQIDVVELDPAVVKVAEDYFHFHETDNMKVIVSDARVFIKRAGLQHKQYDLILLDAFNGDYIPEHLMTREFLQETKELMTQDGVLVANTFSTSKLYDHESVTYRQVFGPFFNFKIPNETGNRVIIASNQALPKLPQLINRAQDLVEPLQPYGVPITQYPLSMQTEPDWDTSVRPLTDQYSPANLLR